MDSELLLSLTIYAAGISTVALEPASDGHSEIAAPFALAVTPRDDTLSTGESA